MTNKRPFTPAIINKLDNYLLLHKPEIWSARTHLVAYYGILFMALLTGICFIVPDDPRSSSPFGYWLGFVAIICIIALVAWLFYLLRFNVFKRFGNITAIGRLQTFVLYFIAVGIIILFGFIEPGVESIKANKAYSNTEIINDVNTVNQNICTIEFDSLPNKWHFDTTVLVAAHIKKINKYVEAPADETADSVIIQTPITHKPFREMTAIELQEKKEKGDSIIKISDSIYQVFESPDFQFIKIYQANKATKDQFLNSIQLYNNAAKHQLAKNKKVLKEQINTLITKYKYSDRVNLSVDDFDSYSRYRSFHERFYKDYNLNKTHESLNNIAGRKFRWDKENIGMLFKIFFYYSLVFTLLIFIFRHSTIKAFFLSVLTGVILSIITTLLSAFFNYKIASSLLWMLIYFAAFATIASFVAKNKTRNIITGICINLFVMMVAFVPVIAVSYYQTFFQSSYSDYDTRVYNYDIIKKIELFAEFAGPLLLIVLLPTYIHWLYRKWYSLPQE